MSQNTQTHMNKSDNNKTRAKWKIFIVEMLSKRYALVFVRYSENLVLVRIAVFFSRSSFYVFLILFLSTSHFYSSSINFFILPFALANGFSAVGRLVH